MAKRSNAGAIPGGQPLRLFDRKEVPVVHVFDFGCCRIVKLLVIKPVGTLSSPVATRCASFCQNR